MENNLELGVIGDFIAGDYHPTPLKGVVGDAGLKPEHFADAKSRAALQTHATR